MHHDYPVQPSEVRKMSQHILAVLVTNNINWVSVLQHNVVDFGTIFPWDGLASSVNWSITFWSGWKGPVHIKIFTVPRLFWFYLVLTPLKLLYEFHKCAEDFLSLCWIYARNWSSISVCKNFCSFWSYGCQKLVELKTWKSVWFLLHTSWELT